MREASNKHCLLTFFIYFDTWRKITQVCDKWLFLTICVGGRVVRPLLQLSKRWVCNIWLVGRMKFASLDANLCGGWGLKVDLCFSLLFSSF